MNASEVAGATRVQQAIEHWRLDGRRLRVACSGGVDSAVLLHALCLARRDAGLPLPRALHVHHGIAPTSDGFAAAVRRLCAWLDCGLDTVRVRVAPGGGLETRARAARYAAFRHVLADGDVLLLAHQADDAAETVLLALLRGGGPHELAGIPARRPLAGAWIERPLLAVDRDAIVAHAQRFGIAAVDDPANADPAHARNRVRHRLLPLLREHEPRVRERLHAAARASAWVARAADAAADTLLARIARDDRFGPLFDRAVAGGADPALLRHALQRWLSVQAGSRPGWQLLDALMPWLAGGPVAARQFGVGPLRLLVDADRIRLVPPPVPADPRPIRWDRSASVPFGHGRVAIHPGVEPGVALDLLECGARLRAAGSAAIGDALRDRFRRAGVPPLLRRHWPVVVDASGRPLWVPGFPLPGQASPPDRRPCVRISYQLSGGSEFR